MASDVERSNVIKGWELSSSVLYKRGSTLYVRKSEPTCRLHILKNEYNGHFPEVPLDIKKVSI